MNHPYTLYSLIGALLLSVTVYSQEKSPATVFSPPVPAEVFFGNDRIVTQVSINKKFAPQSRFGVLTTSFTAADYANDKTKNESMNVALFNFELVKGFGLVSGAAVNSHWGFRPFAGAQLHYANPRLVTMLIPGIYLTESHNIETVGFVEYRPSISKGWSLYSRLEGLYNADMDAKKHDRSYMYARLGLNRKSFSFGFGMNQDWYGPFKHKRENFGLFVRNMFR